MAGIPREEIDWSLKIDENKCIGCERKVYAFDFEKNKPIVARSNNFMVGCITCQVTSLREAISFSFPSKDYVREIIKEKDS